MWRLCCWIEGPTWGKRTEGWTALMWACLEGPTWRRQSRSEVPPQQARNGISSRKPLFHSSNRVPAPRKRAPSGRASRVATVTHTHRVRTHSALPNAHGRCVFSTLKRACAPHARLALLFSFSLRLYVVLEPSPLPFALPLAHPACPARLLGALAWHGRCVLSTLKRTCAPQYPTMRASVRRRERSQARHIRNCGPLFEVPAFAFASCSACPARFAWRAQRRTFC